MEFDALTGSLHRADGRVDLDPRCARVLSYLLANPDRPITKDELLGACWPATAVADQSICEVVHLLRRALGETAAAPVFLRTLHGRGVLFTPHAPTPEATPASAPTHYKPLPSMRAAAITALIALLFGGVVSHSRDSAEETLWAPETYVHVAITMALSETDVLPPRSSPAQRAAMWTRSVEQIEPKLNELRASYHDVPSIKNAVRYGAALVMMREAPDLAIAVLESVAEKEAATERDQTMKNLGLFLLYKTHKTHGSRQRAGEISRFPPDLEGFWAYGVRAVRGGFVG